MKLLHTLLPFLPFAYSATSSTLLNPILAGFHPDPSCISVAEAPYNHTFFCASSSFSVFPGVPVHASKDLVNWRLISDALSRPEQLPALALTNKSTSGIWAPALRYHDGVFYILTTLVFDDQLQTNFSRWDNFIVSTTDPVSRACQLSTEQTTYGLICHPVQLVFLVRSQPLQLHWLRRFSILVQLIQQNLRHRLPSLADPARD